jgi:mannose-6-phosphate isomerase-like protein (cupin superfamily)
MLCVVIGWLFFLQRRYSGRFDNLSARLTAMNKASLDGKFALIHEHWRPKVVAALNGQELKLVKFAGVFPWHHHENEDELFLVWRGEMTIEFRTHKILLQAGEFCVVPRQVEHRTIAESEAEVLVFEPAETRNTGNVVDAAFTAPNGVAL